MTNNNRIRSRNGRQSGASRRRNSAASTPHAENYSSGGVHFSVVVCRPEARVPMSERLRHLPRFFDPTTNRWTVTNPDYFAACSPRSPPVAELPLPPAEWWQRSGGLKSSPVLGDKEEGRREEEEEEDVNSSMEANTSGIDLENQLRRRLRLESLSSSEDPWEAEAEEDICSSIVGGGADLEVNSLASESSSECKWSEQEEEEEEANRELPCPILPAKSALAAAVPMTAAFEKDSCVAGGAHFKQHDWSSIIESWGYNSLSQTAASS